MNFVDHSVPGLRCWLSRVETRWPGCRRAPPARTPPPVSWSRAALELRLASDCGPVRQARAPPGPARPVGGGVGGEGEGPRPTRGPNGREVCTRWGWIAVGSPNSHWKSIPFFLNIKILWNPLILPFKKSSFSLRSLVVTALL